jgi:hypothetical protein
MAFVAWTYDNRLTANSYATVAELDAYANDKVDGVNFTDEADKQKHLMLATQRIEFEEFKGYLVYTDSVLSFPRSGLLDKDNRIITATAIPEGIKKATFELAIYIKNSGTDITAPNDTQNYKKTKVGEIDVEFKDYQANATDLLNPFVWAFIQPFLKSSGGGIRVSR